MSSTVQTIQFSHQNRTNLKALPPLAIYIHIPWCVRKCPYCDFNSHESKQEIPEQAYLNALRRDLELSLPLIWGRPIYSVFFGGGTPSLFSGEAIEQIISMLRMLLRLDPLTEITMEANPGTMEVSRFRQYREAGVNRLSMGIQSFNDSHLQALGRIHSADEAKQAITQAQSIFDNINLDLMYGLPQQSLAQALADVETALSFKTQHLSCYNLTLEPNTLFYHQPPNLPDDELCSDMQQQIEQQLAQAGYEHYETSAFARPGKRCKHNLNYWQFGDYLGIGAGAHSKLSFHDRIIRQVRHKQPQHYIEQSLQDAAIHSETPIQIKELSFEFMMNALRLNQGFASALYTERTGLPLLKIRKQLDNAVQKGLLQQDHDGIQPTLLGQRFLNDLLQDFLDLA